MVSLTPRQLNNRERGPGTHWIGDWVGPRDVLEFIEKRKMFALAGKLIHKKGRN
jgi:hypothetical protein